jgi:hypothetical protein
MIEELLQVIVINLILFSINSTYKLCNRRVQKIEWAYHYEGNNDFLLAIDDIFLPIDSIYLSTEWNADEVDSRSLA